MCRKGKRGKRTEKSYGQPPIDGASSRYPYPTIVLDEAGSSRVTSVSLGVSREKLRSFFQYITSLPGRKHKKPLFAKAGATPGLFNEDGLSLLLSAPLIWLLA